MRKQKSIYFCGDDFVELANKGDGNSSSGSPSLSLSLTARKQDTRTLSDRERPWPRGYTLRCQNRSSIRIDLVFTKLPFGCASPEKSRILNRRMVGDDSCGFVSTNFRFPFVSLYTVVGNDTEAIREGVTEMSGIIVLAAVMSMAQCDRSSSSSLCDYYSCL